MCFFVFFLNNLTKFWDLVLASFYNRMCFKLTTVIVKICQNQEEKKTLENVEWFQGSYLLNLVLIQRRFFLYTFEFDCFYFFAYLFKLFNTPPHHVHLTAIVFQVILEFNCLNFFKYF